MKIQGSRLQKKKRPNRGLFRCALLSLIAAAVVLSFLTLLLAWFAFQKDQTTTKLGGNDIPHPEARHKEPQLRKPIVQKHDRIVNEANGNRPKDATKERVIKMEEKHLKHAIPEAPKPAGTSNSEIYQPPKSGKRLLYYGRFGGRLNNQLFQFITALQHAKVLKRTLVVPNEVRDVDWTGMFDGFGIWDLESLNNAYDIDWKTGLSPDFVLTEIPDECIMTPRESTSILNGGPKLWEEWDKKCPDVIDIGGKTGLLFCQQQHQFCGNEEAQREAYKIYDHIKLSHSLMQNIPSKKEEFKNKGFDELAIHSRRAGEGGYDWELCVNGNTRTCKHHIAGSDQKRFCDERTMKGNCAAWLDLEYQIKSKWALKKSQKDYKFVLASDGTHDWNIDFKHQFIVANNTDWLLALDKKVEGDANPEKLVESMAVSEIAKQKLKNQKDLSKFRVKLDSVTATLLDLFSLVDSKYLLGGKSQLFECKYSSRVVIHSCQAILTITSSTAD